MFNKKKVYLSMPEFRHRMRASSYISAPNNKDNKVRLVVETQKVLVQ